MIRIRRALLGIALMVVGGLKLNATANTAGSLILPGCMGGQFVIPVDVPEQTYLHCWGCYVALAGFIVLGSAVLKWQNSNLLRRS